MISNINGHSDPHNICNTLNTNFANVGKCVQEQNKSDYDITTFEINTQPTIFELKSTTEADIHKVIDGLSNTKSSSVDGITSNMLKCCKTTVTPILLSIFNRSIQEHAFPNRWKIGKVTPLYKTGDKCNPNNYRPISILATTGKLLERIVHT